MTFCFTPFNTYLLYVCLIWKYLFQWGFSDSSLGKESACNAGDPSLILGLYYAYSISCISGPLLNSNSNLRRMTLRGSREHSCSISEMEITNMKLVGTCLLLLYLNCNFKFRKGGLQG